MQRMKKVRSISSMTAMMIKSPFCIKKVELERLTALHYNSSSGIKQVRTEYDFRSESGDARLRTIFRSPIVEAELREQRHNAFKKSFRELVPAEFHYLI
jgi:hypothetical protein